MALDVRRNCEHAHGPSVCSIQLSTVPIVSHELKLSAYTPIVLAWIPYAIPLCLGGSCDYIFSSALHGRRARNSVCDDGASRGGIRVEPGGDFCRGGCEYCAVWNDRAVCR